LILPRVGPAAYSGPGTDIAKEGTTMEFQYNSGTSAAPPLAIVEGALRSMSRSEYAARMTRTERDTLGPIEVPAQALWGAQTQRSLVHFSISSERMPLEIVHALAVIKSACALVNRDLGLLRHDRAMAIITAAEEVIFGQHIDDFPLSVWQTGSGTHSNMNMNEVLANRASELLGGERGPNRCVHPNDDVNLGQSSNDVFSTAMHIAAARGIVHKLLPALNALRTTLDQKATSFADIVKIGRTHLQDATPITLGQEFSAYVAQLDHAKWTLSNALESLYPLAVGGTAVGTGFNTHPEFGARVAAVLVRTSGLPFFGAPNRFAAIAAHDGMVTTHGALKGLATALMKLANDVRWLASGPRSGIGELRIPANEPGSSFMPGKINPTQCEALTMICSQVMANDVAVGIGGASGNFELNAFKPLIAHALLQSIRVLADGMTSFNDHCASGIEADQTRIAELLQRSLMLVTALAPHIGHDEAAKVARFADRHGISLRDSALALGVVTAEEFDCWVQPRQMVVGSNHPTVRTGADRGLRGPDALRARVAGPLQSTLGDS
jgi:fumarate hydratase class II